MVPEVQECVIQTGRDTYAHMVDQGKEWWDCRGRADVCSAVQVLQRFTEREREEA